MAFSLTFSIHTIIAETSNIMQGSQSNSAFICFKARLIEGNITVLSGPSGCGVHRISLLPILMGDGPTTIALTGAQQD